MSEQLDPTDARPEPPKEGSGGGGEGQFVPPELPDRDHAGPWIPWDGSPIRITDLRVAVNDKTVRMPVRQIK